MTLSQERQDLVDEVVKRWNDNQRASTIAMAIGATRNSVIGIVNRARAKGLITRVEDVPVRKGDHRKGVLIEPKPVTLPPPRKLEIVRPRSAPKEVPTSEIAPSLMSEVSSLAPSAAVAEPKTLIDAPLYTCRVVVGQNERGQDLYCCAPRYRLSDGKPASICCCEAHKPRMFSKHRPVGGPPSESAGAIDRISTTLQREQRGGKKFFAFGKTLGISNE